MGFFTKAGSRLDLMSQMMEQTGSHLDANVSQMGTDNLRTAIVSCLSCKSVGECKKWLEEPKAEVDAPGLCPNANLMKRAKELG